MRGRMDAQIGGLTDTLFALQHSPNVDHLPPEAAYALHHIMGWQQDRAPSMGGAYVVRAGMKAQLHLEGVVGPPPFFVFLGVEEVRMPPNPFVRTPR